MTKEDKELLLKDLCARLAYNTIVQIKNSGIWNLKGIEQDKIDEIGYEVIVWHGKNYPSSKTSFPISICKPYLFPLSSMTEEQKKEWQSLMIQDSYGILYYTMESYDYLNKKHFDYRGLIEKGIAIDATGLNIYKV